MRTVTETSHLIIRTWQESDLSDYANLLGDNPPNSGTFSANGPDCRAETELWRYQLEQDTRGWSRWAIIYKKNNELIGYCGFSPYHDDIEISWRFLHNYRKQDLVIEAIEAVAQVGFHILGVDKLIAFTSAENRCSAKVMKQVGMTLECMEGWSNCIVARYSLSRARTEEAKSEQKKLFI